MAAAGAPATHHAVAALLFLQSAETALNAYSTLNSSPWTAENFGADPDKAKSCRRYVRHAVVVSAAYAGVASAVGRSWWPLAGAVTANVYLWWMYETALRKGAVAGSTGWAKS